MIGIRPKADEFFSGNSQMRVRRHESAHEGLGAGSRRVRELRPKRCGLSRRMGGNKLLPLYSISY